jgi:hypothetical protein
VDRGRAEGLTNEFRHFPDLKRLIVRDIKRAAMDTIFGDGKKLLYLVDNISNISVSLVHLLSARMRVQALAHGVKESSIGDPEPWPPNGSRPDYDPRNPKSAGPHDLLAFYLA